jgi:hypothetical protein
MFITDPDPDFLPIPDPEWEKRIPGSKKAPDPDPQHYSGDLNSVADLGSSAFLTLDPGYKNSDPGKYPGSSTLDLSHLTKRFFQLLKVPQG